MIPRWAGFLKKALIMSPMAAALAVGLILGLVALVLVTYMKQEAKHAIVDGLISEVRTLGGAVSAVINADTIAGLKSPDDFNGKVYRDELRKLVDFHNQFPDIEALSVIRIDDAGVERMLMDTAMMADQLRVANLPSPVPVLSEVDRDPAHKIERMSDIRQGKMHIHQRDDILAGEPFVACIPLLETDGGLEGYIHIELHDGVLATRLEGIANALGYAVIASILASALAALGVFFLQHSNRAREREREHIEKLLHRQRMITTNVIENLDAGVIVHDSDNRLAVINPVASETLGDPNREGPVYFPDIIWEYANEDGSRQCCSYPLKRIRETGEPISGALYHVVDKNDHDEVHAKWILLNGHALEMPDSMQPSVIFTFIDVSKLREAQDNLRRANHELRTAITMAKASAEDAELANKAKSEFLSVISHEVRTPLNSVMGFADILLSSDLNEEDREYVRTIRSSGFSLLELINQILDFTKLESGEIQIEDRAFLIEACIAQLIDMFGIEARKRGIALRQSIGTEVPSVIWTDEPRLRQVLVNLVANALKFTNDGSVEINVAAENLNRDDSFGRSRYRLLFSVDDTGIGLTPEQVGRIFRPFTQADSSTSRKYGGTGLGLAICKRICNALNGDIWAQSPTDHGSSFKFWIEVAGSNEHSDYDDENDADEDDNDADEFVEFSTGERED